MTADDHGQGAPEPDPWADLEALSSDEGPATPLDAAAEEGPAATPESIADDDIDAWLGEPAQPLTVFAPDEPRATDPAEGDSAVEIGTGDSGIPAAGDIDPQGSGSDPWAEDALTESQSFPVMHTEPDADMEGEAAAEEAMFDTEDVTSTEEAIAVAASTAAAASATPRGRGAKRPARRKKGVLGQLIGVVLGGALAIPVVAGILIGLMWVGWPDTMGIRRKMPKQLAFLLPPPAGRGAVADGPDLSAARTLDDLGVPDAPADQAASDASGTEPEPGTEPAAASPAPDLGLPDVAVADEPADSAEPVDPAEPVAAGTDPLADILGGNGADSPAEPPAEPPAVPEPPPPPEPEPLDTAALDTAAQAAKAAFSAVVAVEDPADPVRKRLLVDWYRSLARVAEELALLERLAADTGRPLTEPPAAFADMQKEIAARPRLRDELSALTAKWLAFGKRTDGVVMPVLFASSRRVGPWWCSKVTLVESDAKRRDLLIVTRSEPAAVPGDVLLATGLTIEPDVVWASDLRSVNEAATTDPLAP